MEKAEIKALLRETFVTPIREEQPQAQQSSSSVKKNPNYDKDYADIQNRLQGTMLKQNQVMAAAGLGSPDDATARSLFSKKLRKDKNDEGGLYQFSDEELASIIKVVNNPSAFLSTKKGHNG